MIEKILFLSLFLVLIPNAYATIESNTEHGSLQIENQVYEIIEDKQTLIKAWGTINDVTHGSRLSFVVFLPDGLTEGLHVIPTSEGYFETFWMLDEESQLGQYRVLATYEQQTLGEVTFEVKEKEYTQEELMSAREILDQINEEKTGSNIEFKEETKYVPTITKTTTPGTYGIDIPKGTSVPGCEESNSCYSPADITVNAGDTVEWVNVDTAAHTVTSGSPSNGSSGGFDSGLLMGSATYAFTFESTGSYDYFCMVHPWMVGSIIVEKNSNIVIDMERKITIDVDDHSMLYPFENNNKVQVLIEIENYSASDGDYFVTIRHVSSNKIITDFKIFPKYFGYNKWVSENSISISNSDIMVNNKPLLGTYKIQVTSENNPTTATAKFSILESRSTSTLESKTSSSEITKSSPKVTQSTSDVSQQTSKVVNKNSNQIQKNMPTNDNNGYILIIIIIIIIIVVVTIIVIKMRNQYDDDSLITHYDADNYDVEEDYDKKSYWK